MNQTQRFWADVQKYRAQLPTDPKDAPILTSLENSAVGTIAGRTTRVGHEAAARCLAGKTHRLATEDEIKAFLEDQARRDAEAGLNKLKAGEPLIELIRAAVAATAEKPAPVPAPPAKAK
jgi:hypothetical protein